MHLPRERDDVDVARAGARADAVGKVRGVVRGEILVERRRRGDLAIAEGLLVDARSRSSGGVTKTSKAVRSAPRATLVLGSGGAARAAIFALGQLGVARVMVRCRTERKELARVLEASGSPAALSFEALRRPCSEPDDLAAIVQGTTAGMNGSQVSGDLVLDAVAWATVPPACIVYDVVYAPPRTPLLVRATERGLSSASGLGMLVGQGALAFALWLGVHPPRDAMRAALR